MYFEKKVTLGEVIMAVSLIGGAIIWWGSQTERLAEMDAAITEVKAEIAQQSAISTNLQDATTKILEILDWNHLAIPNRGIPPLSVPNQGPPPH
jgi:hypothetical protein